jgi:hypothetical protein
MDADYTQLAQSMAQGFMDEEEEEDVTGRTMNPMFFRLSLAGTLAAEGGNGAEDDDEDVSEESGDESPEEEGGKKDEGLLLV